MLCRTLLFRSSQSPPQMMISVSTGKPYPQYIQEILRAEAKKFEFTSPYWISDKHLNMIRLWQPNNPNSHTATLLPECVAIEISHTHNNVNGTPDDCNTLPPTLRLVNIQSTTDPLGLTKYAERKMAHVAWSNSRAKPNVVQTWRIMIDESMK
eukprot:PhF_6_TR25403/c0_g1_i1/m.35122